MTFVSGEVGLLDLARMTIAEHFEEHVGQAGSRVEVELAHAANRVNYNQVGGTRYVGPILALSGLADDSTSWPGL